MWIALVVVAGVVVLGLVALVELRGNRVNRSGGPAAGSTYARVRRARRNLEGADPMRTFVDRPPPWDERS